MLGRGIYSTFTVIKIGQSSEYGTTKAEDFFVGWDHSIRWGDVFLKVWPERTTGDGSEIQQAPVDMVNIPLFTGFHTCQVVSRIPCINSSSDCCTAKL